MNLHGLTNVLRKEAFNIKKTEFSVSTVSSEVQIVESPGGGCRVTILGAVGDVKNLDDLVEIEE